MGRGDAGRTDDVRGLVRRIDRLQRSGYPAEFILQVALNAAAKGVTIVKGIVEGQEFRIATLSARAFWLRMVPFRSSECAHRSQVPQGLHVYFV